ncbi:MAG TPA: hypothetical protein VFP84_21075 [Kofleriaceae bacterium]|nr:hypothetical protein [Kofleriaceae bacterium]
MHHRLEGVEREAERLRRENDAMRAAVGGVHPPGMMGSTFALPPGAVYRLNDVYGLPLEERARLAQHTVRPFPVWAVGVLNVITFGLFPLIHFSLHHDRLPRATQNDPSAGRAIGFSFIPYYNLYWCFFNALRLCDRLSLQLQLRGQRERAPRGLVLAACIVSVIPYLNLVLMPILWTIAGCMLQATINRVAALSPSDWDATVPGMQPGMPMAYGQPAYGAYPPPPGMPYPGMPMPPPAMPNLYGAPAYAPDFGAFERQARARKLVVSSHVLGWGGIAVALGGGALMMTMTSHHHHHGSGGAGAALLGIGIVLAIVGAVLGQIGRGLQGRAI